MRMDEIPRIKNAVLTDQILVKLDLELGQEVRALKKNFRVDVQEIIRKYLRKELPRIKAQLMST